MYVQPKRAVHFVLSYPHNTKTWILQAHLVLSEQKDTRPHVFSNAVHLVLVDVHKTKASGYWYRLIVHFFSFMIPATRTRVVTTETICSPYPCWCPKHNEVIISYFSSLMFITPTRLVSTARRSLVTTAYDPVLKPVLTDVLSTETPGHYYYDLVRKPVLAEVLSTKPLVHYCIWSSS